MLLPYGTYLWDLKETETIAGQSHPWLAKIPEGNGLMGVYIYGGFLLPDSQPPPVDRSKAMKLRRRNIVHHCTAGKTEFQNETIILLYNGEADVSQNAGRTGHNFNYWVQTNSIVITNTGRLKGKPREERDINIHLIFSGKLNAFVNKDEPNLSEDTRYTPDSKSCVLYTKSDYSKLKECNPASYGTIKRFPKAITGKGYFCVVP